MKKVLAILAGLWYSTLSVGQVVQEQYFADHTFPRVTSGWEQIELHASQLVTTLVNPGTYSFEWNAIFRVDNFSDYGENAALYAKHYKYASGHAFGGVFEVVDLTGTGGNLWGVEIDVMTNGKTLHNDVRTGLGIVVGRGRRTVWRDPSDTSRATVSNGIWLLPNWYDRQFVDVDYGVRISTACNVACLSVKQGEKVCLNEEGTVCFRYNGRQVELINGNKTTILGE